MQCNAPKALLIGTYACITGESIMSFRLQLMSSKATTCSCHMGTMIPIINITNRTSSIRQAVNVNQDLYLVETAEYSRKEMDGSYTKISRINAKEATITCGKKIAIRSSSGRL